MPTYAQAQNFRVVVFGDSLTSGYKLQPEEAFPAKLDRKLKQIGYTNVSVENMSVAGDTTASAVERVNNVILHHPDIVVLELGGNDALRGISPSLVYQNLASILSKLLQNRITVILIGMKAPANLGYQYTGQFETGYQTLATGYKLPFYPFALEGIFGKPELNLADGYHPNAKGVETMVEHIYPLVDEALRQRYNDLQYQQYQQQATQPTGFSDQPVQQPGQPAQPVAPPAQ